MSTIPTEIIFCGRTDGAYDNWPQWQLLARAVIRQAAMDARRRQSHLAGPALSWLHSADAALIAEAAGLELPEVRP